MAKFARNSKYLCFGTFSGADTQKEQIQSCTGGLSFYICLKCFLHVRHSLRPLCTNWAFSTFDCGPYHLSSSIFPRPPIMSPLLLGKQGSRSAESPQVSVSHTSKHAGSNSGLPRSAKFKYTIRYPTPSHDSNTENRIKLHYICMGKLGVLKINHHGC